jgi:tRNA(Ile)-lysidine synthase
VTRGPGETGARIGAALARLAPEGGLGVAFSGGGDSAALALAAARWGRATGRRVEAATVDHRLRGDSRAEAEAAGRTAARLGLAHAILTWEEAPGRGNLQAAARAARVRLLGGWARERGLAAVALGHTLDDRAETLLLRLARGSGADGLAAMAERVVLAGMLWLRPCLALPRAELRALLKAEGVGWAEDPTNEDAAFDRVRARRALGALAPLGIEPAGLAGTAGRLAEQRRVLLAARDRLARDSRSWGACGEARLDPEALARAERDTALGVLADTLGQIGRAEAPPRHRALARLLEALADKAFPGAALAGVLAAREGQRAVLAREPAAAAPPVPLAAPGALWDGRWRLRAAGPWPAGATVGALGEAGAAALSRALARTGAPPPGWIAAPGPARLAAPAIRDAEGALLAVPAAGFRAPGLPAACRVTAGACPRPGVAARGG